MMNTCILLFHCRRVITVQPFFSGVLLLSVALSLGSDSAWAQQDVGYIGGTVTDSTGSLIAGADIRIVNDVTGITQQVKSNDKGFYQSQLLSPGRYTMTIVSEGFKSFGIKNVVVDAATHVT